MPSVPRAVLPLLLLAILPGASRCGSGPRASDEAPLPPLVDARGVFDPGAFEALVHRIEERRGLRFLRRPVLTLTAADDERFAALRDATPNRPSCVQERESAHVLCLAPPATPALSLALAELLDFQHYPALVGRAADLSGDPGEAVRALLTASARAAAGAGLGPPLEMPPEPSAQDTLGIPRGADVDSFLILVATTFLRVQSDREAPFRNPPLSTRHLLSPRDYRAGMRPDLLRGAAPELPGCAPAGDTSVGPAALLRAVTGSGGEVRVAPLVSWRGDRAVQLACGGGRSPWVYVADFDDPRAAEDFAAQLEAYLPGTLPRPFTHLVSSRRVLAWHEIPRDSALAWAGSLRPSELRSLEQLE